MGKRNWAKWAKAALIRAVKTFAQTAAASITVGATMAEVDWRRVLSVSGVAFVLSMMTSLGGLPEVDDDEPWEYYDYEEDLEPEDDQDQGETEN